MQRRLNSRDVHDKYKWEPGRLQILAFAGLVVVVLPAFLSGCDSEKYSTDKVDKTDSKKKESHLRSPWTRQDRVHRLIS